ncbi:ABC transporter ATP-binding protein [Bacillus sp. SCS-151]|uniref:ABC transporter ATP-binding protein n=1 Tax=Nanhaiella sioensis TaxID=3115293 RepID=UPI00397A9413
MSNIICKIDDVSKSFNDLTIIEGISLTLYKGEAVAVIGKNGSGKSTLLKLITGLIVPSKGTINLPSKRVGYVPEQFTCNIRMTTYEYLYHLAKINGYSRQEIDTKIMELLNRFELIHVRDKQIQSFSKGMKQKVSLIQALIHEPDILVLDEPLSGLDRRMQSSLVENLLAIKETGTSMVFSCHEKSIVDELADKVLYISDKNVSSEKSLINEEMDAYEIICKISQNSNENALNELKDVYHYSMVGDDQIKVTVRAQDKDQLLLDLLQQGHSIILVSKLDAL